MNLQGDVISRQHYDDISRAFQGLYWRSRGFTVSDRVGRYKKCEGRRKEWTKIVFGIFVSYLIDGKRQFFLAESINNPFNVIKKCKTYKSFWEMEEDGGSRCRVRARGFSRATFAYI